MKKPFSINFLSFFILALCLCCSVTTVKAEAPQTPDVLVGTVFKTDDGHDSSFDAIKKTYAEINTLTAQFHQKIVISSLKKERGFAGKFSYKRHKGFLWQYVSPKGKFFLYDGRFIWQGEDDKPFVQKNKVNKEKTDGTFLDLVEDTSKLGELFNLKSRELSGNMEMLTLIPKKDSTIRLAKVWIDGKNMINKIELHEFTGNINTIEFASIKVNQQIEDTKFMFKPDKEKEIIAR